MIVLKSRSKMVQKHLLQNQSESIGQGGLLGPLMDANYSKQHTYKQVSKVLTQRERASSLQQYAEQHQDKYNIDKLKLSNLNDNLIEQLSYKDQQRANRNHEAQLLMNQLNENNYKFKDQFNQQKRQVEMTQEKKVQ